MRGAQPDAALARQRYDAMLEAFGTEIYYVHEPLGAAHSYAARLSEPATILVADFRWRHHRLFDRAGGRTGKPAALRAAGVVGDRDCGRPVRLPD